jgi:hypothetical protein
LEAAILALIIDAIGVGAALFSEVDVRRSHRKSREIVGGLQTVDPDAVMKAVGPVRLAGLMRGALSAKDVEQVIQAEEFRALMRELLFAAIVEERRDSVERVIASMRIFTTTALRGKGALDDAEHFASGLGELMSEICHRIVEEVRESDPDAVAQMQQVNLLRRVAAILDNIDKHNAALVRAADDEVRAVQAQFLADYRVVCAEEHGYIRPPDFETNRKIAMEQLYVLPSIVGGGPLAVKEELSSDEFVAQVDRTVVLGDPGGGKSTLSNYVTAVLARDQDAPVPFHVILRDFAASAGQPSVLAYIEQQMAPRYQVAAVPGVVEDLLLSGKAIVIFDGLDELVDPSRRRDITKAVELFGIRYPLARILVTSRRVGYEQARLDPAIFSTFVIDEFTPEEVREYVQKWFQSQSEYSTLQAEAQAEDFMTQSEAVPDLRSNPLMLALMCIIFRGENFIPRNRPDVYERCANLLFEKWDGHRGIEVPLQARDHVSAAMKFVAFRFLETESGDSGIGYRALVDIMTEYLYPRAAETEENARRAAEEFVDFCKGRAWVFTDAGTTAEGESLYTFTHRTFMEYFAAVHLTRISETPEALALQLLPRVAREEWDVVAQLAVQQAESKTDSGTERTLRTMLFEKRKRTAANRTHVLRFIARCTAFAVVSPAFIRELSSACLNHLFLNDLSRALNDGLIWPWIELMRSLRENHRVISLAAQTDDLESALSEPGTSRQTAIWFMLYGLSRALNFRIHGVHEHVNADDMTSTFVSLIERHRSVVDELVSSSPSAGLTLAWYRLASPAETVAELKRAGSPFGEIYFGGQSLAETPIPSMPVTETLIGIGAAGWEAKEPELQSIALEFAEAMLTDFSSDPDRDWPEDGGGTRAHWHGYGVLFPQDVDSTPEAILEASVIASLGNLELMSGRSMTRARGLPRTRKAMVSNFSRRDGGSDLHDLAALPVREEIQQFVRAWIENKASVFGPHEDPIESRQNPTDT